MGLPVSTKFTTVFQIYFKLSFDRKNHTFGWVILGSGLLSYRKSVYINITLHLINFLSREIINSILQIPFAQFFLNFLQRKYQVHIHYYLLLVKEKSYLLILILIFYKLNFEDLQLILAYYE